MNFAPEVALNFALTEGQGAAIVGARNGRQALEMLGANVDLRGSLEGVE